MQDRGAAARGQQTPGGAGPQHTWVQLSKLVESFRWFILYLSLQGRFAYDNLVVSYGGARHVWVAGDETTEK